MSNGRRQGLRSPKVSGAKRRVPLSGAEAIRLIVDTVTIGVTMV